MGRKLSPLKILQPPSLNYQGRDNARSDMEPSKINLCSLEDYYIAMAEYANHKRLPKCPSTTFVPPEFGFVAHCDSISAMIDQYTRMLTYGQSQPTDSSLFPGLEGRLTTLAHVIFPLNKAHDLSLTFCSHWVLFSKTLSSCWTRKVDGSSLRREGPRGESRCSVLMLKVSPSCWQGSGSASGRTKV